MCAKQSDRFGLKIVANAAAFALALGAMTAYSDGGLTEQRSLSPQPLQARAVVLRVADLEKAFWMCDHAATTRGVHASLASMCGAVTEELKTKKFDGDFEQMLGWWRRNKLAEYEKLESGDR